MYIYEQYIPNALVLFFFYIGQTIIGLFFIAELAALNCTSSEVIPFYSHWEERDNLRTGAEPVQL